MFLPQLQHILKFLDFSPDDADFTCIFPLPRAQFRRCQNAVNKKDRQSALALRAEICALDLFEDAIETYLQAYAQLCCCARNHRAQIGDPPLLKQLSEQWKKQLVSSNTLSSEEPCRHAANHADYVDAVSKDEVNEVESILHRYPTTPKNPRRPRRDATPEPFEVKIVKDQNSIDPQDPQTSSPEGVGSDEDCRTPTTRPKETTTLYVQLHQCQRKPTTSSEAPLRTIVTRSQTGSLPWSFTPRRRPAEKTMLKTLTDPISLYSSQVGVIYLYTRPSDPGYIKLGCTTRSTTVRMGEWEKSCGYKPVLLYATEPVPNVRRLESLLKKELSLQGRGRQETYCKHNKYCRKNHTEWFQIDLADAQLLVNAWVNWMREASPYECIAKVACRNPPVAVIQGEWQRYFESLSRRKTEIRSECLRVLVRGPSNAVEHETATDIYDFEHEGPDPEDYVSEMRALQRPIVQAYADTPRKANSLRLSRKGRDDVCDEAMKRGDGSHLVDNGSFDPYIAAFVVLAASALYKTLEVHKVAASSTSTTDIPSEGNLARPRHQSSIRILEERPRRQITAC
jgi:T5orf172 domain